MPNSNLFAELFSSITPAEFYKPGSLQNDYPHEASKLRAKSRDFDIESK